MKSVKIADLKDHLSEHLKDVEAGEEILVMNRDRPIAKLSPVRARRALKIIPPTKPVAALRNERYPPLLEGVDVVDILREERGDR